MHDPRRALPWLVTGANALALAPHPTDENDEVKTIKIRATMSRARVRHRNHPRTMCDLN